MNSAMNTLHLFTKNAPVIVTADGAYDFRSICLMMQHEWSPGSLSGNRHSENKSKTTVHPALLCFTLLEYVGA